MAHARPLADADRLAPPPVPIAFAGVAHICYHQGAVPLPRATLQGMVDMHARRLQVQERLTRDTAACVAAACGSGGVMVVVEAAHMCMASRGVQKPGSSTCTTAALGAFSARRELRQEFLRELRRGEASGQGAPTCGCGAGGVAAGGWGRGALPARAVGGGAVAGAAEASGCGAAGA